MQETGTDMIGDAFGIVAPETEQQTSEKAGAPVLRPRRLRGTAAMRRMVRENRLTVDDLVAPMFVVDGEDVRQPVESMPGQFRWSVDVLVPEVQQLKELGIPAVALFPAVGDALKDKRASEALNRNGLLPRAVSALKNAVPEMLVITDVALDPYSSDGHDGIVRDGKIVNDETLGILAEMAVVQAEAGADIVAPSDMMDRRVRAIRSALDDSGFADVAILSYTAKYASSFYGPFRDALDSAPRELENVPADKKTYQMDPANADEAVREARLDIEEGADMIMVKPGLPYLDVVSKLSTAFPTVPCAVYNVSGEYAMIKAAGAKGWLDEKKCILELLTGFKRAGADIILTYHAREAAEWLSRHPNK